VKRKQLRTSSFEKRKIGGWISEAPRAKNPCYLNVGCCEGAGWMRRGTDRRQNNMK
jgi:hypothetical protein